MRVLTAVYDLAIGPISFDFVTFLVRAMGEQRKAGCDRLHVVLLPHTAGLGGFSRAWGGHDEAETRSRLWRIVIASCPLAGATVALMPDRDARLKPGEPVWWPKEAAHHTGPVIEAARQREMPQKLRATDQARAYVGEWLDGDKVATITLRQCARDPQRNSNVAAWDRIAAELTLDGYRVVAIGDSDAELRAGRGYAALDPDLRLALYERAEINFIGHNGPGVLCWFSNAAFLQFGCGLPAQTWGEHARKHLAMKPGDQLPWATTRQRLVWRPDDLGVIHEELAQWEQRTSDTATQ